jgi:hypothetical protein
MLLINGKCGKIKSYEEGHKICWKEEKSLQIEPNITYRKCKESAHMSRVANPISESSLDISPSGLPTLKWK